MLVASLRHVIGVANERIVSPKGLARKGSRRPFLPYAIGVFCIPLYCIILYCVCFGITIIVALSGSVWLRFTVQLRFKRPRSVRSSSTSVFELR